MKSVRQLMDLELWSLTQNAIDWVIVFFVTCHVISGRLLVIQSKQNDSADEEAEESVWINWNLFR